MIETARPLLQPAIHFDVPDKLDLHEQSQSATKTEILLQSGGQKWYYWDTAGVWGFNLEIPNYRSGRLGQTESFGITNR